MDSYETYYNLVFGFLAILGLSAILFGLIYKPKKRVKSNG